MRYKYKCGIFEFKDNCSRLVGRNSISPNSLVSCLGWAPASRPYLSKHSRMRSGVYVRVRMVRFQIFVMPWSKNGELSTQKQMDCLQSRPHLLLISCDGPVDGRRLREKTVTRLIHQPIVGRGCMYSFQADCSCRTQIPCLVQSALATVDHRCLLRVKDKSFSYFAIVASINDLL